MNTTGEQRDNRISLGLLAAAAACWETAIILTAGAGNSTLCVIAGAAVLLITVLAGERMDQRTRLRFMAAVIGVIVILGVILHGQIADGFGTLANTIYERSEATQAYLYDRFTVTEDPDAQRVASRVFIAWAGSLLGAGLALLPAAWRKWSGAVMFVILAAGLAYFGIVPAMIPMGLLLMIMLLQRCSGNLTAALPLLAAAAILFAALCVADPGENNAVSRADEQMRDRLAVSTVSLQGQQSMQEELQQEKERAGGGTSDSQEQSAPGSRKFQIVLGLSLLILAVLLIPAIIRDRLEKRRRKNRQGIDSEDPAEAIRALFPYTLRWLSVCGIQAGNRSFRSLDETVSKEISIGYGDSYRRMASLWEKAVYSDQPVTEEHREEMGRFLEETKEIVDRRCGWRGKIRTRLQMAL